MSKPPSQNAIARALGMSSANMVKLKKKGCPVDSVESARAWHQQYLNVAARKRLPASAPVDSSENAVEGSGNDAPSTDLRSGQEAQQLSPADFFPRDLPPSNTPPWSGDGGLGSGFGSEPAEDHQAARTRREIAEANLAEMRELEERGDLIRISSVQSKLSFVFSTTREAFLQMSARLSPVIAAQSDPAAVQNMLDAEIHQALHQLSGASSSIGQKEGAL